MDMKTMRVKITTVETMLGSASANKDLFSEFIASNAPDAKTREEEIEAVGVDGLIEKSMTVFPKDADGSPMMWDYQIKGFFKDACGMLKRVPKTKSSTCKAYKKVIDGLIFIDERKIKIKYSGEIGRLERSLRAQTAQGW